MGTSSEGHKEALHISGRENSGRGPTKRDMTKKTEGEKKQNKEESQHKTEHRSEAKVDQGSITIATK